MGSLTRHEKIVSSVGRAIHTSLPAWQKQFENFLAKA